MSTEENGEALKRAAKEAAFQKYKDDLKENIQDLRKSFDLLLIQDQFLALSIIGRAYHYVDDVEARIKSSQGSQEKLNLDVK